MVVPVRGSVLLSTARSYRHWSKPVTYGAWIERAQRRRPASGRGIVTRLTFAVNTWVKTYLTAGPSLTRG
jgi:hypothetical protein